MFLMRGRHGCGGCIDRDFPTEWTMALTKHLREQLIKMTEYLSSTSSSATSLANTSKLTTSFLTAGGTRQPTGPSDLTMDFSMRQWNYSCRLAYYMYHEGLLDRFEFLYWMLEQLERLCGGVKTSSDATILKLIVSQIVKVVFSDLLIHLTYHYLLLSFIQFIHSSSSSSIPHLLPHQLVHQYILEFTQSQMLARKLAHFCCRKLSIMSNESSCAAPSNK